MRLSRDATFEAFQLQGDDSEVIDFASSVNALDDRTLTLSAIRGDG
jgi:hypothetical protein